jgi:hypothetical protein
MTLAHVAQLTPIVTFFSPPPNYFFSTIAGKDGLTINFIENDVHAHNNGDAMSRQNKKKINCKPRAPLFFGHFSR